MTNKALFFLEIPMRRISILIVLALFMGFTSNVSAVIIPTHRDIFLQEAGPGNHFGGNQGIVVGLHPTANTRIRSLVGFDVSSLAGLYSSIDSITLTAYTLSYQGVPKTVQVYEVVSSNSNWVENPTISGGVASNGDSTWNSKFHHPSTPTAWTGGAGLGTPGTGYGSTPLASRNLSSSDFTTTNTPITFTLGGDLTALMDRWMSQAGGANASLLMRISDETPIVPNVSQQIAFYSRNNTSGGSLPTLTITFTPIPEPCSLLLCGCGALALGWVRRSAIRQISKR